ncbi:spore germination protein [Brevibacillus nitrificans]|uniref:spore germination protein n=1 Tax=Brevibacillus nitrificans TaxID=651560 RepID=UPI002E1D9230|nr:spore germination protein [Brevibacillus nitrificans]
MRDMTTWFKAKIRQKQIREERIYSYPSSAEEDKLIHSEVEINKQEIRSIFGNTADLHTIGIRIQGREGMLSYLSSTIDLQMVNQIFLGPLSDLDRTESEIDNDEELERYMQTSFSGKKYVMASTLNELTWLILSGYVVVCLDGMTRAVALYCPEKSQRAIEEPTTQTVIKGPKEGFTESAEQSITLIRKRIKNPKLLFEPFQLGTETHTSIYLAYIDGIINPAILQEVRKRIQAIHTNAVFDSGMIEEFITDKTMTPFPLVFNTERPDTTAANLISGKAIIIVDGSPFVLTIPATLNDFFQISEDYYQPFMMATFIRFIRYIAFLIALVMPAAYVAIITYHHELLPTPLMISIMAQRESIPFPAVVEVLIMEFTFEILREAGIRMPRAVGMTVSVVGGLVIGQAAVEAGIISSIMVIIVALTAIASFVSPVYSFSMAARLLRFGLVILAASLGLYGVMLGLFFMVGHLNSLRSFGIPYLSPMAPFILEDQKDVVLRFPVFSMKKRPHSNQPADIIKQPNAHSPTPPQKEGT